MNRCVELVGFSTSKNVKNHWCRTIVFRAVNKSSPVQEPCIVLIIREFKFNSSRTLYCVHYPWIQVHQFMNLLLWSSTVHQFMNRELKFTGSWTFYCGQVSCGLNCSDPISFKLEIMCSWSINCPTAMINFIFATRGYIMRTCILQNFQETKDFKYSIKID